MIYQISTTRNILLPHLQKLTNEKNFVKREVISRCLAITAIFFRTIDVLSNLMVGFARCGGRLLREMGVTVISKDAVSNFSICANFKGARDSLIKEPLLLFKLTYNPQSYLNVSNDLGPISEEDQNWGLENHFGHIYVINLDDNEKSGGKYGKRLEQVSDNLNNIGCSRFERFRATYGPTEVNTEIWSRVDDDSFGVGEGAELDKQHQRQAGCYMSHYRALLDASQKYSQALRDLKVANTDEEKASAQAKIKEYDTVLILEDDNGFGRVVSPPIGPKVATIKGTGAAFRQVMRELPKDWDMFYFVAFEGSPLGRSSALFKTRSSAHRFNHLKRVKYGLLTNAIAINSKAYPELLSALGKIVTSDQKFRPVDHEYALLHQRLNVFTPKKPLAYQAACDSSISSGFSSEPWDGSENRGY